MGNSNSNDSKAESTSGTANPKTGAGSGISKPSSTDGDTGPKTTTSTGSGTPTVDEKGSSVQK